MIVLDRCGGEQFEQFAKIKPSLTRTKFQGNSENVGLNATTNEFAFLDILCLFVIAKRKS